MVPDLTATPHFMQEAFDNKAALPLCPIQLPSSIYCTSLHSQALSLHVDRIALVWEIRQGYFRLIRQGTSLLFASNETCLTCYRGSSLLEASLLAFRRTSRLGASGGTIAPLSEVQPTLR